MPFQKGNKHGHRFGVLNNPSRKLTPDQVRLIREMYSGPTLKRAAWKLAEDFGVTTATVYKILHRVTWGWLP